MAIIHGNVHTMIQNNTKVAEIRKRLQKPVTVIKS